MENEKKAEGDERTNSEVEFRIEDFNPTPEQLDNLKKVAEGMVPEFLTKIGAPGKQVVVIVTNKHHPCM